MEIDNMVLCAAGEQVILDFVIHKLCSISEVGIKEAMRAVQRRREEGSTERRDRGQEMGREGKER